MKIKMIIEGVILDIDGTILDSMTIWDKAGEMFLESLDIRGEKNLSKIMDTMSMIEGAKYLKNKYSLDITTDEIRSGVNNVIENFYHDQVKLKKGAYKLIRDLKHDNVKIVAATASDRNIVESALKRLDIMNYFEKILTCTEVGVGKLQPDIYLYAANCMKIPPKKIWVFEDALYALETAKNAGFKTVGVLDKSSRENWDTIKNISDIYLEDLSDFTNLIKKHLHKDRKGEYYEDSINDCGK